MLEDVKVYDAVEKEEICLSFFRKEAVFTASIVSHKDEVYKVKIGKKTYELPDSSISKVDPIDETNYKFFMEISTAKDFKYWKENSPVGEILVEEEHKYNMTKLATDLLELTHQNLDKFANNMGEAKPYVALGYASTSELINKVLGSGMAILASNSPIIHMFVICWIHGYLSSSAVKKQGVQVATEISKLTDAEVERRQEVTKGYLKQITDAMERHQREDGGSDHGGHNDQEDE
jgi:hypothetical protein